MVCSDEKPVTLHAEVRPPSPAAPGREARRDSEYKRRGTANVFCAVESQAGCHFTFVTPDRSGYQFAQMLFHCLADTRRLTFGMYTIHREADTTLS